MVRSKPAVDDTGGDNAEDEAAADDQAEDSKQDASSTSQVRLVAVHNTYTQFINSNGKAQVIRKIINDANVVGSPSST